ncbi:MAG: hypothetical protein ACI9LY_003754 [Arenicella sp.]|jgi:hypothetical protein
MIFRRVKAHIEKENWFAVGVDFFIVVVGVFVGLQVSNWNEEKSFDNKETELLHELRKEMNNSIIFTDHKIDSYSEVSAAGKRSLDFLSSNVSCGTECWPVLVDFMHASQWQGVNVKISTYENMRRIGLPRNNAIVDAVEVSLAQVSASVDAFSDKPYYRAVVRQLVSYEAQEFYWDKCHSVVEAIETYDLNCPKGIADAEALALVEAIAQNPEIKPHLTQWFSLSVLISISLKAHNVATQRAVAEIDAELERR